MAAWPPVGGGRMDPHGKQHHDFDLSGCRASSTLPSYGLRAWEGAGGGSHVLSGPVEPNFSNVRQRPRRRAVLMLRVGITRRGRAECSRMVPVGIATLQQA